MITLVSGGARSGKSKRAESLIRMSDGQKLYIATAIPYDDEMKERIKKHQESRPSDWTTFEGFKELHREISENGARFGAILLDCVTIWMTNLMFDYIGEKDFDQISEQELNLMESTLMEQVALFIDAVNKIEKDLSSKLNVVLVTNEIGMGLVPETKLSRVFRDIQGRVNQYLGNKCDHVELVVCGIPMKIK